MATAYEQALSLTVEEIGELSSRDGNPEETLANIVVLIANRFEVDVCSVYLLEPDRNHLMLAATVGLRQECVGQLRMSLREGLAGFVAEELRPLAVKEAAEHPRFKYFKETGEDSYHSFLGVPLIEQGTLQGVLVIQTIEPRGFTQGEVGRLVDAAARLGPIVSEARTLEHFIAPSQERLSKVVRNLWWSWTPDVVELFRDIDPVRWRQLDHNPVSMLAEKSLKEIEQRAGQLVLHSRINHAYNRLGEYVEAKNTWSSNHAGVLKSRPVAYFSAEFGLHESLPIYSGGLGVLAGDHVKSASDLGVPLIGIGLFYDQGYFHQRLDSELWQQEEYIDLNVSQLPLMRIHRSRLRYASPQCAHPSAESLLSEASTQADLNEQLSQIGLHLDELHISQGSPLAGRKIGDIEVRGNLGFLVVALRRADGEIALNPDADTHLSAGDTVIVLGHNEDIPQLVQRYILKNQITYRGASVVVGES